MLNGPLQQAFGQIKSRLPGECLHCRWLLLCRGGCPKDRVRDQRDRGLSHFCASYKMFFDHADARFRELASEWTARKKR
jgi:uncharacterized protein